jgi:hypothetical protein
MAADYLNHLAGGPIEVRSAGSEPADKISADSARAGSFPASPRVVGHLSQSSRRTLRAFIETEKATLECGDLGDAVVARLTWWVDGHRREAGDVDPAVSDLVRQMQRRAFEVTAGWADIEERELDPAGLDRRQGRQLRSVG